MLPMLGNSIISETLNVQWTLSTPVISIILISNRGNSFYIKLTIIVIITIYSNNEICGKIRSQAIIQVIESVVMTIKDVNKRNLLPNITLGWAIVDNCDKQNVRMNYITI